VKHSLVVLFMLLASVCAAHAQPVPIIFDTDMGNDVDDALALAVLHALESRGEAKLLAVTLTKDNRYAAPYVDLVNTFYGRPDIPIGVVKNGKTPEDSAMIRVPCERKRADGTPVYPRRLNDGSTAPDASTVLRRVLESQPDNSVTIVQVGFFTNMARLLDTDRDLIARKVRLLVVMAGAFPTGIAEYNVKTDLPASRKVFAEWPTPIVARGLEIGNSILYTAVSIARDYRYVENHPIVDAYRAYKKMPYDRQTWDLTAVLYAVRPDRGYFSLSPPGQISTDEKGRTHFTESPGGKHRYLIVNDTQRVRVLEALVQLASQPPK
ncbi:MAG TPA: nucleoside hydrolase, partial [Bryobacteraceae bacterium]|nr:nucleoside hydrolase [Bryobacteraceae bacterium]